VPAGRAGRRTTLTGLKDGTWFGGMPSGIPGVYRPPLPAAEAAAIMQAQAGQLDPDLLRVYRPIIFRAGDAAGGPSVRS
jgi:hypothetical protein